MGFAGATGQSSEDGDRKGGGRRTILGFDTSEERAVAASTWAGGAQSQSGAQSNVRIRGSRARYCDSGWSRVTQVPS